MTAEVPCPECGKEFRGQKGLEWHMERSHPVAQQAVLGQSQSEEAAATWQACAEQLLEEVAELRTEVQTATGRQTATEMKIDGRLEKVAAEVTDRLTERVASLERRVLSLESERGALKTREDSYESRLRSLDRRISALEPKPKVCTSSLRVHH